MKIECQRSADKSLSDQINNFWRLYAEGIELYKKFKLRFMEANFNIRKWRTNNNELKDKLEIIESQENVHNSESIQKSSIEKIETDDNCSITNRKVLDVEWDEQNDILKLGVREIFGKVTEISPTKRNILKVIASVYDPIGILQPIIIKLKLLFQEICLLNIDWDDDISPLLNE